MVNWSTSRTCLNCLSPANVLFKAIPYARPGLGLSRMTAYAAGGAASSLTGCSPASASSLSVRSPRMCPVLLPIPFIVTQTCLHPRGLSDNPHRKPPNPRPT